MVQAFKGTWQAIQIQSFLDFYNIPSVLSGLFVQMYCNSKFSKVSNLVLKDIIIFSFCTHISLVYLLMYFQNKYNWHNLVWEQTVTLVKQVTDDNIRMQSTKARAFRTLWTIGEHSLHSNLLHWLMLFYDY